MAKAATRTAARKSQKKDTAEADKPRLMMTTPGAVLHWPFGSAPPRLDPAAKGPEKTRVVVREDDPLVNTEPLLERMGADRFYKMGLLKTNQTYKLMPAPEGAALTAYNNGFVVSVYERLGWDAGTSPAGPPKGTTKAEQQPGYVPAAEAGEPDSIDDEDIPEADA